MVREGNTVRDMTSPAHSVPRRASVFLLAGVVMLQAGCVTAPPVPETRYQPALGRVAVAAAVLEPEIKFRGFVRGKGKGAAVGAGTTFIQCFSTGAAGTCSGPYCGALATLWLGVCGVASAVGGVVGATAAPSAREVRSAETEISSVLNAKTIQESLRDQVAAAASVRGARLPAVPANGTPEPGQPRDYRPLGNEGVDTVLEVALVRVGTEGAGFNAPVELRMEARVRLVRARDNTEFFTANYLYMGERLKLAEWSANRAERLLRALQTGYETLGAHIHDNIFLLYSFPDREPHAAGTLATSFGLAPLYPRTRGMLTGDQLIGKHFEWAAVDGLQPTLRWQGFPRETDLRKAPEEMARIKNVRYDLRIAREHNLAPAGIVYRREGLKESAHRIETPLSPDTRYFWTVRARFELDGRERVTEWGVMNFMARELWTAPSSWSYRFRTP